jgi:hypothetical protein
MAAMLVETFEVTETYSDGSVECEAEALELIEKLGLVGQKKLVTRGGDDAETRIPYRKMKSDEALIYKAICPETSKLASFSDSAIPVRVLQVAAHAVCLFDEVLVWHAKNADVKDPVLVGRNAATAERGWTEELYILARWGEELLPLDELAVIGGKIIKASRLAALRGLVAKAQAAIAACEATSDAHAVSLDRNPHAYGID